MTTAEGRGWLWQFGNATLDGAALELRVDGELVAIEPRPLEMLLALLRHPGEVVTKDELLESVWPGRVVTEGVLVKAAAKVRAALGDDDAQIVRTVHGYGYRLVADVRVLPQERSSPAASALDLVGGDAVPNRPHWRLQRTLGEGGHGEVWLAQHAKTREHRVFKFARTAAALIALKREITLFRLLHDSLGDRPDLVPLLDWSLDEPPYFIESAWSPAGSLLDWSQGIGGIASVPLAQRIALVAQVAEALSAAHGVGVLHKDIKPANILIGIGTDDEPYALLGDFGSGRVLDLQQLEALGITRLGYTRTLVDSADPTSGTPLYLAPEVMAGHAQTLRSDIYSLGVLLYQMIVGDLRRPLAPGWEREIDDDILREDITACVDGDPQRRLADAAELARRLRELEPRRVARMQAQSAAVQLQQAREQAERMRRKRRVALALAAVAGLGLLVSLGFHLQARHEQQRADREAATSRAVANFLNHDLLGTANPFGAQASQRPVGDLIEQAAGTVATRFASQPAVAGQLHLTLGSALAGMGRLEPARAALDRAIEVLASAHGDDHDRVLAARLQRTDLEARALEVPAYQSGLQQLEPLMARLPSDHELTIEWRIQRAWAAYLAGDHSTAAEALAALRQALPSSPGVAGVTDADGSRRHDLLRSRLLANEALALVELGRADAALPLAREAVDLRAQHYGPDHPETLLARFSMARALLETGQTAAAATEYDILSSLQDQRLGREHKDTLLAYHQLGTAQLRLGRFDAAATTLAIAADGRARHLGDTSFATLNSRQLLAAALLRTGHFNDAERQLQTVLTGIGSDTPYERQVGISARRVLGDLRLAQARPADALVECEQAAASAAAELPATHAQRVLLDACRGLALMALGLGDEAQPLLRQVREGVADLGVAALDALPRIDRALASAH